MKILFLALSILLCNLIFGQTAIDPPNFGEPDAGASGNPYRITNIGNLYWISIHSEHWNKYYIQTENIDLSLASPAINTWNGNTGWSPIGSKDTPFTGSYNGQGHIIIGLYISRPQVSEWSEINNYLGLFGSTNRCSIQNVGLTNVSITGCRYLGGLVGYNWVSTISNSYSIGNINGIFDLGGLIGANFYTSITNCYSSGYVNGQDYLGGLVGSSCCAASGFVSAINNSYSTAIVSGSVKYAGGLVGFTKENAEISNSYFNGRVDGSGTSFGGLVGYDNDGSLKVTNCFWNKTVNPTRDNGIGSGITTDDMILRLTYYNAGWDYIGETVNGSNDYWGIDETGADNNGFPFLYWQGYSHRVKPIVTTEPVSEISFTHAAGNGTITFLGYPNPAEHGVCWSTHENPTTSDNKTTQGAVSSTGAFTSSITGLLTNTTYYVRAYATNDAGISYGAQVSFSIGFEGSGTDGDPLLVKSLNDLKYLADHSELWNLSFKQTVNIDASATGTWSDGGWTPIGNSITNFTGKYDGNGYTIDGLYISRTAADYQGLFGYINGSIIKDLGLTNVSINCSNYAGGLAGYNVSSTISNCYSSGNITAAYGVGGLIGYNDNSPISNSYSSGSVTSSGSLVGGLIGYNFNNSVISNSYSSGNIIGTSSFVGGLVGFNGNSSINNSYSSRNVNGSTTVGGLIGRNNASTISNCYSSGSIIGSSNVGGLVGSCSSSFEITGCFWDITVNPSPTNFIGIGTNTADMKKQETYLTAGWDPLIWNIGDGINSGYPYLKWQNPGGTPLPVEITSFTVKTEEEKIILNWQTATELNNYGFEVERTSPGYATPSLIKEGVGGGCWEKIGFVPGSGNSNSPKEYIYIDACPFGKNPLVGNIQYRLKQMDMDGGYKYYSQIAEVNYNLTDAAEKISPAEFALEQNYPNPFNPTTSIKYSLPQSCNVTLDVYSILGKKIITLINKNMTAGYHEVCFDGGNLNSGVYIYRLTASLNVTGKQFTKSAKMILVK